MLTSIIRWFQPPKFPEDEDKTRSALLLNVILNTFIFTFPIIFVGVILGGDVPRLEIILIIIFSAWILMVGIRFFLLAGHITSSAVALITILFTAVTLAVYNLGTIRAPTTSFYILTIVMSGLIIGRRAILWMTGINSFTVIMLLLAERNGILPKPSVTITIAQGITFVIIFVIISILLYLAVKSIDESLARVRLELSERAFAKEREINRREIMEKVIQVGKSVTEQTSDFRTAVLRIWDGVHNGLDFDRTGIFLYNPNDNMMQGSYGTNRSGELAEEWNLKFRLDENAFFQTVISQPDGFYFTQDYAGERNLSSRPGHPMGGVKYYAAVAVWSGDEPAGIICVDQLTSGRIISGEQLEGLRLFAGYAGLAIQNARLNAELEAHAQERESFIQELGNRNAELERFTYTVSHDLRSPLVTIKGFLGMLEKDMRENKQDRMQTDFKRIAGAAEKMDLLLADLLELSRIGRVMNPAELIKLADVVQDALESIHARIHTKNITVRITPNLPTVYADRIRMREVLENLIDNAAKYMGDQPNPLIEIGANEGNEEYIVFVKDNGMGIDPQYHTKIFSLFEKLNPESEGTGIGLALIKRIIEVHGGRIWVESDGVGNGSTFFFTIPKQNNDVR